MATLTLLSGSGAIGCSLGGGGGDDGDDGPDLTGATVHEYRVMSVAGSATNAATSEVALDLDFDRNGDESADNSVGQILATAWSLDATFAALFPIDAQCAARLAGDVGWMVTVYEGERGAGVALDDAAPAIGWDLAQALTGDEAMTPLGVLSDPLGIQPAGFVPALRTRIVVDSFTPNEVVLRLAVALTPADVDRVMIPSLAAYFTAALANGPAPAVAQYVDLDNDRVVTDAELRENSVVQSLLSPDLWFEDVGALSFGVRITATAY